MAKYLDKSGLELTWDRTQQLVQECSCKCDEVIYADIIQDANLYYLNKPYMEIFDAVKNGRKIVIRDVNVEEGAYHTILTVSPNSMGDSGFLVIFSDYTPDFVTMFAQSPLEFPSANYQQQ